MTASRQPTRTDSENVIRMLMEQYPACFSERLRRPLKQDIAADIIADEDFAVAPEMIVAAVAWYQSHVGYFYATSIAGTKRIDLNGRDAGTVTMQEALAAQQNVREFNAEKGRRWVAMSSNNPVGILSDMHARGQISDCAVKKLDAPPMASMARSRVTTAPEFAPLYETLAVANAAVVGIDDPAMRAVVAKTLLDLVIEKFRKARSEMENT